MKEAEPCQGNLHAVWDTCIIETQLGMETDEIAAALREMSVPVRESVGLARALVTKVRAPP